MNLCRFVCVFLYVIITNTNTVLCKGNPQVVDTVTVQDEKTNIPANHFSRDSLTKALSDTLSYKTATSFGVEYYKYLDKADKAYRLGFFKRAKRFYQKAYEINPNSLYIQYHLREIENRKFQLSSIVFYLNFDKPIVLIKVLIYLIIFFIVSMLLVLLFILAHRERSDNIEKRKQNLKEVYQELLVDYLFTEGNSDTIPPDLKAISRSSFSRKILIDQMIDLSINLTGEVKEKLRKLYHLLGLDKDSLRKVYSRRWHIKVKGFRELAFMDITVANNEILRCLKSKNEIVRMEAQLALVRLNHDNSFDFLDYLDKPFTLWEQLTVYETIMFHNLQVPKFEKWLTLKNKTVVIFALRMIEIFKQKDAYLRLFWLLVNDDPEIRHHTIKVIGNLRIKEAIPHLKRLYKLENYENCRAIIQAIGKMPDESILNFLKLVIDKEDDVQLQIDAAIAINNSGEPGKNALQKLMDSDYKNYQIIIKHVLDKRIA
jgi:tetratricopeptide (TPR) repeat protein